MNCDRCRKLESIINHLQWMARRYAHGRSTYAVSDYNEAVALAQLLGMQFRPDPIDGLVEAKDGMFDREWFEARKSDPDPIDHAKFGWMEPKTNSKKETEK